jgi:MOSC domain-containing protein YiiM
MSTCTQLEAREVTGGGVARLVAVCISEGGIPKRPLRAVAVDEKGLAGDRHAHEKHNRPDRAISLLDVEIMEDLIEEGYPLVPGATGENLAVQDLHVQRMAPGTLLRMGEVVLKLETPRKPCYVLDSIDPQLKEAIVGRCGYMASVVQGGMLRQGEAVEVLEPEGPP